MLLSINKVLPFLLVWLVFQIYVVLMIQQQKDNYSYFCSVKYFLCQKCWFLVVYLFMDELLWKARKVFNQMIEYIRWCINGPYMAFYRLFQDFIRRLSNRINYLFSLPLLHVARLQISGLSTYRDYLKHNLIQVPTCEDK